MCYGRQNSNGKLVARHRETTYIKTISERGGGGGISSKGLRGTKILFHARQGLYGGA